MEDELDVDQLRTFLAVHRSGGITRAAAELFRSQPAVSRRLALLERSLGAPLFERVPGGVVLSEAGRALLPFAERTLATLHDAEAAVREVSSEVGGPVTVALVGTLAGTSLTAVLRRFAHGRPGVEVTLRTATSQEVSYLVRRADVMFGMRYGHDPAIDLRSESLFDERQVVAAAPDHRLACRRSDDLAALSGERWIAFPEVPARPEAAAGYVRRVLEAAGVPDSAVLRIDSLTAQKRMVEAGFGIALLPESAIQEELAMGSLTVLEVTGIDIAVPVVLITRREGYLGAAARALIDELRRETQVTPPAGSGSR